MVSAVIPTVTDLGCVEKVEPHTKDYWDSSKFNRVPQKLRRLYLGWTTPREWVRYTVDIARAGTYKVSVMYDARHDAGIVIECNGKTVGAPISLSSTADDRDERRNWHHWNFHDGKDALKLRSGRHVLTLRIMHPGNLNLDCITFSRLK